MKLHKKSPHQLLTHVIFSAGLLSGMAISAVNWLTPIATATPVTAKSADAFVDSIGVNTHLTYGDTPYNRFDDIIKPRLKESGIRYIRDGGHKEEDYLNKLKELAGLGIKSNLIFTSYEIDEVVEIVKATSGVDTVEGPNETDLEKYPFSYKGKTFPEGTRNYQRRLYNAIKSDAATSYLPVILPSMGWGENAEKLGYLDAGDICNLHSYPNLAERPTYDIDWYFIPHAQKICGDSKPIIATETGYHNAIADEHGLSEQATGKYLPRMLLENFNRNIKRTFLYEFIDEGNDPNDSESRYGLLRYDGSPKPAFTAIKNMISLLKEPGANFTPKSLDYTLTGNNSELHSTLLQKSSGEFYLILWQDANCWNEENEKDVTVGEREIAINLKTSISSAEIYEPKNSSQPTKTYTAEGGDRLQQVTVSVPDRPIIVKLVP